MSQENMILEYMRKHGSITSLEAYRDLGIMRLAARISVLQDRGHNVIGEYETDTNRYGEKVRFKRYRLAVKT